MTAIINFISFIFLYFFALPFKFLPYRSCLALGRSLGSFAHAVSARHRRIADENIRFAFPEMTESERKKMIRAHFRCIGTVVSDSLYAPRIDQAWMDQYLVYQGDSLETENRVLAEKCGVVMISGHLGSWEVLVHMVGLRWKGAGLYKKIKNPLVDNWYRGMRESSGIRLIPVEDSSQVIKELKKGQWVGFGADQNAGKSGIFINFMNRPASTFQGTVLMAYLTGAKMMYYSVVRGEEDRLCVRCVDMGSIDKKAFPDRDTAVRVFTEKWSALLEEDIRRYPEQYFWVHRRWRTRPEDIKKEDAVSKSKAD